MSALFARELDLPVRGRSKRVTKRPTLEPGRNIVLLDEDSPGCLLHWWITSHGKRQDDALDPAHRLRLRIYYDGAQRPAIDLPLAAFFAILLDRDVYQLNSAAIKVLPARAMNCYLPMPFRKIRIDITNNSNNEVTIWFMANFQAYDEATELTPLRLNVVHRAEKPAEPYASYLMADVTGRGFIAGMVHAVRVRDESDAWYHSGGDTVLLDGESSPSAIRGIGGEDVFAMSHGIWPAQTDWTGSPHILTPPQGGARGRGYEGVAYRFFGPDPIWFETSAVVRFGSKANDMESVIYAYAAPADAPDVLVPDKWLLAGPFECRGGEEFEKQQWADQDAASWPKTHAASFGQYLVDGKATEFEMPIAAAVEHGWCDFARHFRGRRGTNVGTQPADVCAYAVARVAVEQPGRYAISFGYDDRARLWLDGKLIHDGEHAKGFVAERIDCELPAGQTEFRVKLSNSDNEQWRLWAFAFVLERA